MNSYALFCSHEEICDESAVSSGGWYHIEMQSPPQKPHMCTSSTGVVLHLSHCPQYSNVLIHLTLSQRIFLSSFDMLLSKRILVTSFICLNVCIA
jgi:hypothetical protein